MLARLEKIETGLADAGFAGAVVAFDWPSKGNVLAYDQDRNAAKAAAPFLVPEVIEVLAARLPGQDLHLICHSMGCFLTLRALSGKGDQPGADPCLLDQVCFVAADAEAEALHQGAWGALVMARRCSRFTNYYSVADRVLALSGGLIHGGRARAGQVGLPDLTAPNAVDLYTTAQFRRDVPAAEQNDRMVSHNWYYENAGFWEDVKLTLAGQPANQMPTRRPTDQLDQALLT
jgi:esterase/lipase superfamily enzyme